MRWLLLAIIVLAQKPTKAPEGKGATESDNAKSTARAKKTGTDQAQAAQPAPVPTKPLVAIESQRNATTANEGTGQNSQQTPDEDHTTQRYLTWFTGVLAAVGVLQLIVMFLTWLIYKRQAREMRRQRHELRQQRHVMWRQWKAMQAQFDQMRSSGEQTSQLITHAAAQVTALVNSAQAAKENAEAAAANARAAKASADAFMHSQHLWLSVRTGLAGPLVFDEHGAHVTLAITAQNVGQMPAMGVWIDPAIFIASPKKGDVNEERKRMCENIRATTKIGQTVFPGEPATYHIGISASLSEIQECQRAIFGDKADEVKTFAAMIIVVVGYRTALDKDAFYYTAATYSLDRREPNSPGTYALRTETTPVEQLRLYLFPVSGIIAE